MEQRGIEHPATGAPLVVNCREDDAKQTAQDDQRRREVPALLAIGDPVEAALAHALGCAADAGRFDVVARLAAELEVRRLARAGNVVTLEAKTRRRGG